MGLVPLDINKQEKYRLFGNFFANELQRVTLDKISNFLTLIIDFCCKIDFIFLTYMV